MEDRVYVVIEIFAIGQDEVVGASIHEATARMIAASGEEGNSRFIEVYENGEKVAEFGFRE